MIPYLHILIRVEEDESLRALGAFTTREKLEAYRIESGLEEDQVRVDFYNGPFDDDLQVIYAGHKRWNMDSYQQAGYFQTEGEAWNLVTHEGYVRLLRIDTTYQEEQKLEEEALALYAKLQKRWRLTSYEELIARQGSEKARADITLRFYQDALESFKPKTRRDIRALKGLFLLIPIFPIALFYYLKTIPEYDENVRSVDWLPGYAKNISYYRSKEVEAYEFDVEPRQFVQWARGIGLSVERITEPVPISRYTSYLPKKKAAEKLEPLPVEKFTGAGAPPSPEDLLKLQSAGGSTVSEGMVARGKGQVKAVYDARRQRAFFESIQNL
ncbi:MAG: hypothetical protein ACLFU4_00025 [Opitutales bacterium]